MQIVVESETLVLDIIEQRALLHYHFLESCMLLGETFLYVLCVGSHLGRFHQLLNIRQRACEIRGTLGEPFLQMRVVLIVGCGYYDLVVLQLEAFSHVVHLCLNGAQSCLILQYQFGVSATEMSREQVDHTVE